MASEQQGSHSSGQSEEIIELQPQDKQKRVVKGFFVSRELPIFVVVK